MCDQPPDCQKAPTRRSGSAARRVHRTGRSWSGQGARPCKSRPRPAVSGDGRLHSPARSIVSCMNPQGKPAGLRSIRTMRDGADVALLTPILQTTGCPARSRARAPGLSSRSQTSQAKVSKVVLRKEVIQPQVPLRLPCYDLVPITGFIFGACLAAPTTSDAPRFGGLTGGVYKAQEHIHRRSADRRLLAIPASCGRVAARNPN